MSDLGKATCEFVGTAFLVIAVVGSGIMGERLAGGNEAIVLLCNSIATGGALVALIFTFSGYSGAHFNPVVTISSAILSGFRWRRVSLYIVSQISGGMAGVVVANAMFGIPLLATSARERAGGRLFLSEVLATLGLLLTIHLCGKFHPRSVAPAVASYITGAYWFFPSTSFANPAVTIARAFTSTFTGIRPSDVAAFCTAQIVGALLATVYSMWILGQQPLSAPGVGWNKVREKDVS
jgi:glycerol uptake facilitator-like aquaporin